MTERSRRGFVAACAAGIAGLAGCRSGPTPPVTGVSVDQGRPRRVRAHQPPVVAFEEAAVVVTGFMYYGSSSCDRITVADTEFDESTETLTVHIVPGEQSTSWFDGFGGRACTADLAGDYYRATIRVETLPATVTVVEDGLQTERHKRTVSRTEQQAFCTTAHDNATAADRAHWSCPEEYIAANVSVDRREE